MTQSIFKTLAFFDAQNLALTLVEIQNYLLGARSEDIQEIENTLRAELSARVGYSEGFYFLKGRGELAGLRQEYYRESLQRLRKAKKVLYFVRFIPYVRAVALSGSVALLGSHKDSDIDLFILTSPRRIWLARLFVSGYFQLLGLRRHGRNTKNRFCLNHYLAASEPIDRDKNLYTAVEYASLMPVLGRRELQKFWEANTWIKDYLPNATYESRMPYFDFERSFLARALEFIFDFTGIASLLNWLSGLYQKKRIRLEENIIVSDRELSFHPQSRGQQILTRFDKTVN